MQLVDLGWQQHSLTLHQWCDEETSCPFSPSSSAPPPPPHTFSRWSCEQVIKMQRGDVRGKVKSSFSLLCSVAAAASLSFFLVVHALTNTSRKKITSPFVVITLCVLQLQSFSPHWFAVVSAGRNNKPDQTSHRCISETLNFNRNTPCHFYVCVFICMSVCLVQVEVKAIRNSNHSEHSCSRGNLPCQSQPGRHVFTTPPEHTHTQTGHTQSVSVCVTASINKYFYSLVLEAFWYSEFN